MTADQPTQPLDVAAIRHLVLDSKADTDGVTLVMVACSKSSDLVPYDRTRHTYLTALTGCADCRAVHAAWHVAFVASLG